MNQTRRGQLPKSVTVILGLFLVALTVAVAAEQDEVTLLRYMGEKPLGTYAEWVAEHPLASGEWRVANGEWKQAGESSADSADVRRGTETGSSRSGTDGGGAVAVLVEQAIAGSLVTELARLVANLEADGYTVLSYEVSGGTPAELRAFLVGLYSSDSIEGALFVGDLPVAWFQVANDYGEYGYAEWPIDLFYMDLDGVWLDSLRRSGNSLIPGQDGIYDVHRGNLEPEIYVGRLTPRGMGDKVTRIRDYLRKDNAFRYDTISLDPKALVFVDDDWIDWAAGWAWDVARAYPDTANYWHAETTRASVYRAKLNSSRAWVAVFAHSEPARHHFKYNNGNSWDYYWSTEYDTQDPPANFYNHFACSYARYTENGYGAGYSMFNPSFGVGALGSTKTGSMLDFYFFYQPLSEGKTIGAAYRDWFAAITSGGVTPMELYWHYGMTLLGDPFLKPVRIRDVGVAAILEPSGSVDSGAVVVPRARVRNFGNGPASFPVRLSIGDFYSDSGFVSNLAAGDTATLSFASWTASRVGTHTARCTTMLEADRNPGNDVATGSVTVLPASGGEEPRGQLPSVLALVSVHPNPFAGRAVVRFALPKAGPVSLRVFSSTCEVVASLVDGTRPAGHHSAAWTGRDGRGRPLPKGIYFCALSAGDIVLTGKLVKTE